MDTNSNTTTKSEKKIRANIAQRKKLATPSPSHHGDGSRASLDESLYSSLSNEMYSKIQSPPPPLLKSGLMSESGTASVIEVIEPTASEEEEFKQAFKVEIYIYYVKTHVYKKLTCLPNS